MTRIAFLLALVGACSKDDPNYCGDNCIAADAGRDTGMTACTDNADCTGDTSTPVCSTTRGVCVACTASEIGACAGTTPLCVAATNTCTGCTEHSDCTASDACLPTGACGTDADVAYVATNGNDGNACTKASPCATLTHAATVKPYVKLDNDIDEAVSFNNVTNVSVLAEPGTVIRRTGSVGAVVTVAGTSTVTLTNVVIREGLGSAGHGILIGSLENGVNLTLEDVAIVNNTGLGLSVGGGMLTMVRVLVAQNFAGGGVIAGNFDITSSLFVRNGASGSMYGGVQLTPGVTKHVFDFNTVANNDSNSTSGRGVNCTQPMLISSTIVSTNEPLGCTFEYSLFDAAAPAGSGNKTGNPQFLNTNASLPLLPNFFRIADNSDAIDSAAPSSTVMVDIDGDTRPQGGVRDIGADEYKQ